MNGSVAVLVVWAASLVWIGFDYRATTQRFGTDRMRFKSGRLWVMVSAVYWIVFFPWYLVCRSRQRKVPVGLPSEAQRSAASR